MSSSGLSSSDVAAFLCQAIHQQQDHTSSSSGVSSSSANISSSHADCNITATSLLLSTGVDASTHVQLAEALAAWGDGLVETAARATVLSTTVATTVVLVAALWFALRFLLPSSVSSTSSQSQLTTARSADASVVNADVLARIEAVEVRAHQQQAELAQTLEEVSSLRRQVAQLSEIVQAVEDERRELQVQLNYRRGDADASIHKTPQMLTMSPRQNSPQRRHQTHHNVIDGVATTYTTSTSSANGYTHNQRDLVHSPAAAGAGAAGSGHRTFVVSSSPRR